MKRQVFEDLLTRHANAKRDGDSLQLPSDLDATLYVGVGSEQLIIDRVSSLTIEGDIVLAVTKRKERYLVACEDVRAVRFGESSLRAGY
jgi:hypothetical protein